MAKELPISPRIVPQLARVTVKSLIDGIVELVTNSDDSYKRLEDKGRESDGRIEIYVDRKKGGICKKLIVKDFAEGMTKEELEKAIVFAEETSGFKEGKSVRGLFGRGLKETIIALGEGEIRTVKDGRLSRTKVWLDKEGKPQYDDEALSESIATEEPNGTEINIIVMDEKVRIPEYKKFMEQISTHYALRDIASSEKRKIELIFNDLRRGQKIRKLISFSYPKGRKVIEKELKLPGFGDSVKITIYESAEALDSPRNNPFGLAGILIKTKGAILDNQLFKFANDDAAVYFYGEAICNGLEEALRKGETGIIDPNRGGLEWRHEYCQVLSQTIERVLEPLIFEKRKALDKRPEKEIEKPTKKLLRKLCAELNRFAKQEFEELDIPIETGPDITSLIIKPEVANIPEDRSRIFSIYAPREVVMEEGKEAHIKSDNTDIRPLSSTVKLEKYHKFPEKIWYGRFKVVGIREKAEGTIIAKLGNETALAKVKVAPLKERKKGKITGGKGGFISDIVPDDLPDPPQRVVYREGIIKVYTRFPSVSKFIRSGFEGVNTQEGRLLLSELVGEAFCKELARQGMELGKYPKVPGGEVDSFNTAVNDLQKKYLHKIQEIIFAWKF